MEGTTALGPPTQWPSPGPGPSGWWPVATLAQPHPAQTLVPVAVFTVMWVAQVANGELSRLNLVLSVPFMPIWVALACASVLNGRRHAVFSDGRSVVVRRRWTATTFALDDIVWVIDTVWEPGGRVRVDGAVRTIAGHRLPRMVPWPQSVSTSVAPRTWTHHLGIPMERTRGGGLRWRRRGLR